jgi:hypothetical protein
MVRASSTETMGEPILILKVEMAAGVEEVKVG